MALFSLGIAGSAEAQDDAQVADGLRQIAAIEAAFRKAIEKAQPAVVSIFFRGTDTVSPFPADQFRARFPRDPEEDRYLPNLAGSGVIVNKEGFVLTCYHVVRQAPGERPRTLVIVDQRGEEFRARVHAADPRSDLAVLQLLGKLPSSFPEIVIGDGDNLFRGQFVLAIGNPYGIAADGSTSASWGIISNIRRRPGNLLQNDNTEQLRSLHRSGTLVQTDARLNMGISGGALINTKGELIGVTMALSAATGFETPGGFALPTNELTRRIIKTLVEGREVEYGFLGIQPSTIDPAQAAMRGLPPVAGVLVDSVVPYVPAYRAGVKPQDIIIKINGKPVRSRGELILLVGSMPVGGILDVTVVRPNQPEPVTIKTPLAKFPISKEQVVTNKRPAWNGIRVDYVSTIELTSVLSEPPAELGVVVREVDDSSAAYEKGVRAGSIITRVNGKPVMTPDEFDRAIAESKPPIRLQATRGAEYVFGEPEKTKPEKK